MTLDKWAEDNLPLHPNVRRDHTTVLCYLRQPFFLQFNTHRIGIYTITGEQINFCIFVNFTLDRRSNLSLPYDGEL